MWKLSSLNSSSLTRPTWRYYNQKRFTHSFDYDLLVIGGGSGGLATAQEAAKITLKEDGTKTKKIAVLDFVRPSPQGTSWGLGGTCVNVGCIPKKLMHHAAILGHNIEDARSFGWNLPESKPTHSWETLVKNVQDHVKSLNWGYRTALMSKHVEYINAYGSFVDKNTINAVLKNGKTRTLTADKILIAVGGRPKPLDVPGGEHCLSSDDLFSRKMSPGKTLVIGASYVALECAGFLKGIGNDVTVMARSIFLRGFDQQMAELIAKHMEEEGVKFVRPAVPTRVEKLEEKNEFGNQKLRVFWKSESGEGHQDFDTVLVAVGRKADTSNLGIEKIGIQFRPESDGKIEVTEEKTQVDNIFALGDVIKGNLELTPVAIRAGRLLARRLFGGSDEQMDYSTVPTTVFTPQEYGACGMTEEEALKKHGEDGIEVYHSNYTPLEWTVPHRGDNSCYVKAIYERKPDGKLLGIHILGPNAGEILQGFGVAIKAGATRKHVEQTVGIHPTTAEELVVMDVTKRSGKDPKKTGC